jgi:spermidine/putrescine transport system substrate-binding protein
MKKQFLAIFVVCGLMLTALSGCGSRTSNGEVYVSNWGDYIDEDMVEQFQEETGITVHYSTYSDNESLYATLKNGSTSYDVICPSDYMVARMIHEDMLEEINFDNIPNLSNLDEEFRSGMEYDPEGVYSVPYLWGVVGIIYNTKLLDYVPTSWDVLWDENLAGQILMFDNSRDAIGIALKSLGYSYNTTDEAQITQAVDKLIEQKPLVQAYVMDQIFDKLEAGEAIVGPYYAGDAVVMMRENPDLACVYPEEGSNYYVDAWCIPKGASNKENAEAFINFMCQTEVMAANATYNTVAPPSSEARSQLGNDLADSEMVYAPKEVRDNCETYINLPQETLDLYDAQWIRLKAAK